MEEMGLLEEEGAGERTIDGVDGTGGGRAGRPLVEGSEPDPNQVMLERMSIELNGVSANSATSVDEIDG